jgi:hypothetical protein
VWRFSAGWTSPRNSMCLFSLSLSHAGVEGRWLERAQSANHDLPTPFASSWSLNADFAAAVSLSLDGLTVATPGGVDPQVWATIVALAVLTARFAPERVEWALVEKKARKFVLARGADLAALLEQAKALIK